MFSHFTLGSNDLARSRQFYSAVMATIDQMLFPTAADGAMLRYGIQDGSFPHLFIASPFDGLPATWSNGFHIAFNVRNTRAVDDFHAAAMANGGIDEGPPGLRTEYAEDYYGTYVRDPDGNKLQAVCYTNGRTTGPTGDAISHITLGLGDLERERKFYSAALGTLGFIDKPEEGDDTSFGFAYPDSQLPVIYVQQTFDHRPATWGNGTMTALQASSRKQVDEFHHAAIANGGRCEGAPGLRPDYSAHYYGAYVRDPVGNKLHAVCREPDLDNH